jgi:eukaryotic-like serine/threonine-protein kinase
MSADPNRVRDLFLAAAELAEGERHAFVARECGSDAELRAEVERLLAGHVMPASILRPMAQSEISTGDVRPSKESSPAQPAAVAGTVISGRYTLLEEIGEGGMGTVWMARQNEPVRRMVAIKLIKPGMDSKAVLARFEAERQALALMDHPNIARVLDGGVTSDGRPFFVMDLVKGVPITQYCDAQRLTPRERLELFLPVCHAIQHAHQKGIIHRDVKPSNVLVALYDDRPVPKVIDFGVAKAMGQPLTEQSFHTGFGTVIGTPQYMSPEQATFNNLDVDTRSDLYSLGVLLYELLVGTPPISKNDLEKAGMLEMLRHVREVEPQRPSTKLSTAKTLPTLAANRNTEPKKLTGMLRNELDWVVMKALEKDRTRRYETANGFAADILRYLAGERVQAVPPSVGYRLRTFLRKNRGSVIAASLLLLSLVAGIAGTTLGLLRAETKARDAEKAQAIAEAKEIEANREKANALAQRARAEKARNRTREALDAMTSTITGDSLGAQQEVSAEQKKFLTDVVGYYKEFAGETADDEASRAQTAMAAYRVAVIDDRLGREAILPEAIRQAHDLYAKLADDFPNNPEYRRRLASAERALGIPLSRQGDWSGLLAHAKKALLIHDKLIAEYPAVLEYRLDLAETYQALAVSCRQMNRPPQEIEAYRRKALALLEKLDADSPVSPEVYKIWVECLSCLGQDLKEANKPSEAEKEFRKAVALAEKLVANSRGAPIHRRLLAVSHRTLGIALVAAKNLSDADKELQVAHKISQKLVDDFPAVPANRSELAFVFLGIGRLRLAEANPSAAEIEFQRSRMIQEKLAAENPKSMKNRLELVAVYVELGNIAVTSKPRRYPLAEECFTKTYAIARKLFDDAPTPAIRKDMLKCYESLYVHYRDQQRDTPGMAEPSRKALELLEKLVADYPADRDFRRRLAVDQSGFGEALLGLQKYLDAAELQRRAISSMEKLIAEDPADRELYGDLANAYSALGSCLASLKKFPESAELFGRSIAIFEKAKTELSDRRVFLRNALANANLQLGTDLGNMQNWAGAEPHFRKSLSIYESLNAETPNQRELLNNQAGARFLLGFALQSQNKNSEALEQHLASLKMREALLAEYPNSPIYYSYVLL